MASLNDQNDRCEVIRDVLRDMKEELWVCKRCSLHLTRNQPVLGDGNPCSKIMLVGEAPGRNEDLQGLPFVGKAGKLLDEMLEMVGLNREKVYITNVVKCRPPENRDPLEEEISACKPFLYRQLSLIEPKLIVTLGRFSLWTFLSRGVRITQVRGRAFHKVIGNLEVLVFPTFHPAYVLRNPHQLEIYKRDFQSIRRLAESLGILEEE